VLGAILPVLGCGPIAVLCHDLYPAAAVRLGYLSSESIVVRVWTWANSSAFAAAEVVIVLGENMRENIYETYGHDIKVSVVHNWEDGSEVRPTRKEKNDFAVENGLVDKFTILYSGNHGRLHDLESVVRAAALLEECHENPYDSFRFLFIGGGIKKERLERHVAELGLSTVRFLPYQPPEVLRDSLTCGDVALVSMNTMADGVCVPGKFYTALASGQAVLAIAEENTDIGRIVESTGCGIRVDPSSPEAVAEAIERWLDNPSVAAEMGSTARVLFEAKFSKERAITALDAELSHLLPD